MDAGRWSLTPLLGLPVWQEPSFAAQKTVAHYTAKYLLLHRPSENSPQHYWEWWLSLRIYVLPSRRMFFAAGVGWICKALPNERVGGNFPCCSCRSRAPCKGIPQPLLAAPRKWRRQSFSVMILTKLWWGKIEQTIFSVMILTKLWWWVWNSLDRVSSYSFKIWYYC